MLRAFLITWLIVIEQIMYQMIHAGMTQITGAVRLIVPKYGRVIVLWIWLSGTTARRRSGR